MHNCDVRRDAGTLPGRCEHGTHATYQTRHSVACVECRVCALACARCSQPAGSVPASLDIVTSPRQLLSRSDQRDSTRATVSRAESSPKQPRLPPPALAEADRWRRARWRRRRSEGAGTSENALSFLSRFCVTYSHNEPAGVPCPWGRSGWALGGLGRARWILVMLNMTRGGKGLLSGF